MRNFISCPLDALHNPIVLSEDPDAKYFLSSENANSIPKENGQ